MSDAEQALRASGQRLPDEYLAVVRAMQNLSPRTLADDRTARDWLDVFQLPGSGSAEASHLELDERSDRLDAYRKILVPCLVLGFADDLIAPAPGGREVAAAIPGARYAEIPDAGHYGYLERPGPVNTELLTFLQNKEPA
jgi:pimeloyl-ACP methyl ester carboxylesterase